MFYKCIMMTLLVTTLSGCAYLMVGGGGYVAGRELEEEQGVDEDEVYK